MIIAVAELSVFYAKGQPFCRELFCLAMVKVHLVIRTEGLEDQIVLLKCVHEALLIKLRNTQHIIWNGI